MQSWIRRSISNNNIKHRYFQNITNFPKNQSYSAMHFIFFVKKWCNFLTVYTFLKIAHYLASLTIYLSYLASVQISCMFMKICLFTMRVPNLTMFLFNTILTLNADINSSFCILLNNYPNINVPWIQNLSFLIILTSFLSMCRCLQDPQLLRIHRTWFMSHKFWALFGAKNDKRSEKRQTVFGQVRFKVRLKSFLSN